MHPVILSSEAEQEVLDSYKWYEEQHAGLGNEFILCLDAEIHSIARNPEIYQVVYKKIRRGILKRFPYCVFFLQEPKHIQVLAVFNAYRNPSEWKKRI